MNVEAIAAYDKNQKSKIKPKIKNQNYEMSRVVLGVWEGWMWRQQQYMIKGHFSGSKLFKSSDLHAL